MSETVLDESFAIDERLFHYTTADGLYGILSSNCLWASHYQFLNDKQEFVAVRNSLVSFLSRKLLTKMAALKVNRRFNPPKDLNLREVCRDEAESAIDAMYKTTFSTWEPYVFATFCSDPKSGREFEDGTLQHWSYYAQQSGYALQINPHRLSAVGKRVLKSRGDPWSLGKVHYVDEEAPPPSLEDKFSRIADYCVPTLLGELTSNPEKDTLAGFGMRSFMDCISGVKDNYFQAEREARFVVFRSAHEAEKAHKVYVRTNARGVSIPYIKLLEGEFLGSESPLEKIILGPHPQNDDRCRALEIFVKARGLRVELAQSSVPFSPR